MSLAKGVGHTISNIANNIARNCANQVGTHTYFTDGELKGRSDFLGSEILDKRDNF